MPVVVIEESGGSCPKAIRGLHDNITDKNPLPHCSRISLIYVLYANLSWFVLVRVVRVVRVVRGKNLLLTFVISLLS